MLKEILISIYFFVVIMALNQLGLTTTILYIISTAIILLIILSFLVTGRGLGAVGAFNGVLASLVHALAPDFALSKAAFSTYVSGVEHPPY